MKKTRVMRNRVRRAASVLCCLLFMFALTACAAQDTERIELTLIHGWGSTEPDHVAMRNIYADYETAHPEVRLNLVSMPSSEDVVSRVQDMLTVGEIPDIIFTGGVGQETLYRFMVENGYAVNLTPYLAADDDFAATVADATKTRWTEADGALYTVSDVLLLSGYWINLDLLPAAGGDALPATWDDFLNTCRNIKERAERTGTDRTSVVLDTDHLLYLTDALLANEAKEDLYDLLHRETDLHAAPYTQVMSRLQALAPFAEVRPQFSYRDTLEAFNAGRSVFYINGVWANTMIRDDLHVLYAAFPSADGKGISCVSSNLGYVLGDTGDEAHLRASVGFLKYMLSDEVQTRIVKETGQIASSPRIPASGLSDNERLKQAVSCVQAAGLVIDTPENLWSKELQNDYLTRLYDLLDEDVIGDGSF